MKIIIIILQAILNLVRKRRDLIVNRSKIPPEYRDDVVVLPNTPTVTGYASYNPCACPATTTTPTTAA